MSEAVRRDRLGAGVWMWPVRSHDQPDRGATSLDEHLDGVTSGRLERGLDPRLAMQCSQDVAEHRGLHLGARVARHLVGEHVDESHAPT